MNTELEEYKKQILKRARITATVFGSLAIVAMISLVYAFIQQTKAEEARILADVKLLECRQRADEAEKKVEVANLKLEQAIIDAAIAKEAAEAQSKKSKK